MQLTNIKEKLSLFDGLLVTSLLAFGVKGCTYLLLGQIWLIIAALLLGSWVIYSFYFSPNRKYIPIRIWGILLILWGLTRGIIGLLITISPIADIHVNSQFGWQGNLLSTIAIGVGYYLSRAAKRGIASTNK